jgi:hypothetical protein
MKKLPFQQRRQLPITLKIRILKFWNPTVCSVHSALHPITTQSLKGEGLGGIFIVRACLPSTQHGSGPAVGRDDVSVM